MTYKWPCMDVADDVYIFRVTFWLSGVILTLPLWVGSEPLFIRYVYSPLGVVFSLNVLISFCMKVLSRHVTDLCLWCVTYFKVMLICVMFLSLLQFSFFSSDYICH